MTFTKKKIRNFLKKLDSKNRPKELNNVVNEIEKLGPDAPQAVFKKHLRNKLLIKHKAMSRTQEEKVSQTEKTKERKPFFTNPFRLKGWSYVVAALLIVVIAAGISYPFIPAPKVVGYSLKANVRLISYNAPIKIVFNQPMDKSSVESAFHIEPQVTGKIEWAGNSLIFYPEEEFKIGDRYAVYIDKEAKSIFQKRMEYDYEETFEITSSPEVLLFNPAPDSENVPVDAKITVLFDRPMTALKGLDEGETSVPEMKIDPPVEGKIKLLGTDSFTFIPEKLEYSTKYSVTIPEGTVSAEGGSTDKDFSFSFKTPLPELVSSTPENDSRFNGPDTVVHLNFNQVMDLESAKEYIHIYKSAKISDPSKSKDRDEVSFSVRYMEEKDKEENESEHFEFDYYAEPEEADPEELKKTLIIEPTEKLPYDSEFSIEVNEGFKGIEGEYGLEKTALFSFHTVGELKIVNTTPSDGVDLEFVKDPGQPQNFTTAKIFFSHPIDDEGIEEKIWIDPEKIDKDTNEKIEPSLHFYSNKSESVLSIRYDFEPSANYTIGLKADIADKFGQSLGEDFQFSFKTPSLKPRIQLMRMGDISVLDANKPPVYYLKSVNIDVLNFQFKELSMEEFRSVYSQGYLNHDVVIEGPLESFSKTVENEFNENIQTKIDLAEELGDPLKSGIYYMDVSSPKATGWNNEPVIEKQVFIISSVAMASKLSNEQLLIWATSFDKGEPVSGLDVSVENTDGKEVYSGKTDKNGLVMFDVSGDKNLDNYQLNNYTIIGKSGEDFNIVHSSWGEGVTPWNFDIDFSPTQSEYYIYSYTDRPIYRPGHTVYFKGLVRRDTDARFKLPEGQKVDVTVTDSNGEKVYEKSLDLNSNGTFNDSLNLSENARTGNYTIQTLLSDTPGPNHLKTFYTNFRIAEYRKPDYELTINLDKENYVNGDTAKVKVKGAFFFGAPMPNADIEWTVKSQDYFFFIPDDSWSVYASKWFSFSEDGNMCWWGCRGKSEVVSKGKAKLDENGEYTIELPLDIEEKKLSQLYTVEVTVFDLNNQSVSNRTTLPVHQGEYYMGIRNTDYVVKEGETAKLEVISVDSDGMSVGSKPSEVTLYKRKWNTIKKKNVDGGFYWENSFEDTFVDQKTVTTNNDGYAEVEFTIKDGGNFKAVVTSNDDRGNEISASTTVYVSSYNFINWGRENNDRIELIPDKLEYKPGETAKILVKSPYQNVWALVTQERNTILEKSVTKIESNSDTIEIPITEDSIPNMFVSVVLVKGSEVEAGLNEPPAGENDERTVAAFKAGYTTLHVDNASRELDIKVSTDKDKYKPRDKVTVNVETLDQSGSPVAAEVSVSVVDKSVLSLTENVTADLLNAFYRKRMLGVLTAHTLTKAISRINVQVEAGLKGGGGAAQMVRGIFKDTAHWEAVIETDANGEGAVTFELPDNLTTWEVLAIGITDDTLVGSKKHEFLVTKDVLVRDVLPRFLIVKDKMKVGGIVHNYMGKDMSFDVVLDAKGVELEDAKQKTIHLKPDEEKKVEWSINVLDEKEAVFTFDVQAKGREFIGDILEKRLPIHPYSFPEIVATSQTITDNAKHAETVWLPIGTDQNFGNVSITVSPTLTGTLSSSIEYLMRFPYGCVEQTTSGLLPNVVLAQLMELPIINDDLVDKDKLKKNVETGLQSLYKYQNSSGGWGIWETSDPNPYLSAYVLYTLNEVKKAGYTVDENVMNRGISYVTNNINNNKITDVTESSIFSPSVEPNIRAYVIYVLTELGQGDLGLANNLYEHKDALNTFSKAYLAMALHALEGDEEKITALKNDILNTAKETPRGIHFEEKQNLYQLFDTNVRTTALVMQMLVRIEPDHPYINKILRNLLLEKRDGHFSTTHETAIALISMIEYLKESGELEANYDANVALNGIEKLSHEFRRDNITEQKSLEIPLTDLQSNNLDNEFVFVKDGSGKMYVDMNMKYYIPTEEVNARNEGVLVTHEYFSVDDEEMENPVNKVKLGENLKARVTVVVPEDRYYVMVEDFLPAGLEAIDFSLKTSQQSLQEEKPDDYIYDVGSGYFYDLNRTLRYFRYSEVRDDRMMYFADFLPKGVYELEYYVRATTPGMFHDLPVLAQELYFPEVFGRSGGGVFEVVE
jgi:uncharacterized protein YfaS (alpha-2-macroglobulin family)